MRNVTITAREFGFYLWFAFSRSPVGSTGELDNIVSVLKKMKEVSHELLQSYDEMKEGILPKRELNEAETTLVLEEAEHTLLKSRIEAWAKNIAVGVADEYAALLDKIKDAPKVEKLKVEA